MTAALSFNFLHHHSMGPTIVFPQRIPIVQLPCTHRCPQILQKLHKTKIIIIIKEQKSNLHMKEVIWRFHRSCHNIHI